MMMRAVALLAVLAFVAVAHGAVINVDDSFDSNTDGDGLCSLREAIVVANTRNGAHSDCADPEDDDPIEIDINNDLEASGLPLITTPIDLTGSGVISGIADGRGIFATAARLRVASGITVQEGNSIRNETGGCFTVYPEGTLLLDGATVRNCRASTGNKTSCAGGVYVHDNAGIEAFDATFEYNFGHSENISVWDRNDWRRRRNVNNADFCAGAVYLAHNASELIENTVFHANGGDGGGAVFSVNSVEMLGCSFTNNTAWPLDGGAIMTFEDIYLEGDGTDLIAGNTGEQNGGALFAYGDVTVKQYGDIHDNVVRDSGGVAYSEFGNVRLFGVGGIYRNRAEGRGGALCASSGGVVIQGVAGDIHHNFASGQFSFGGAVFANDYARLMSVSGGLHHNVGHGGVLYCNDGDVVIQDVGGDIFENFGFNGVSVAFADGEVVVERVGAIRDNVSGQQLFYQDSVPVFRAQGVIYAADDALVIRDVNGGILRNIAHVDADFYEAALFSGEDGALIENVSGPISGNIGSRGLLYGGFTAIVRNVAGGIEGNYFTTYDSAFVLSRSGTAMVDNVGGPIARNKFDLGSFVNGFDAAIVRDVNGPITDNVLLHTGLTYSYSSYTFRNGGLETGLAYAGSGSSHIYNINGGITNNVGGSGLLAYAGTFAVVENIGGDIANNIASIGPMIYAQEDAVYIRGINGSISHNTIESAFGGGIVYCRGYGGVLIQNIFGDISENIVGDFSSHDSERGALFTDKIAGIVVRNVHGNIQDNIAPEGVFEADEGIVLSGIHGNITRNVGSFKSAAVAYCRGGMVVENVAGEVTDNIGMRGSIFKAGVDLVVRNIGGDLSRNTAGGQSGPNHASVMYAGSALVLENVGGEVTYNVGQWGGLFYGGNYTLISDIGGDIANNDAQGCLVYGYDHLLVRNVRGGIHHNHVTESGACGMFYSDGDAGMVIENIDGAIEANVADNDSDDGAIFYADDGGLIVRNINGPLKGNRAPNGLLYLDGDGDMVIENIHGNIEDNFGAYLNNGAVGYSDDGYGLVRNIYGSIRNNIQVAEGSIFYAADDLTVQNIFGDVSDNYADIWIDTEAAVFASDASVILSNVTGSLSSNRGLLVYAENFAFVTDVGGDIADNISDFAIIYAEDGGIHVRNVGAIVRNVVLEGGGILYAADAVNSIVVESVRGPISYNVAISDDDGFIVAADNEGSVVIRDIDGDISYNHASSGIAYGEDGLRLENAGEIAYNVLASTAGDYDYFGLFNSYEELFIFNVSSIHHNILERGSCLVYGEESVEVRSVHGDIAYNTRGAVSSSFGLFYGSSGSVALLDIEGSIAHNKLGGFGGIAYADQSVLIKDIGGDIADNSGNGPTIAYAESGAIIIEGVHGGILRNIAVNNLMIHSEGGSTTIRNIYGDIAHNVLGDEDQVAGLIYGSDGVFVDSIYGSIHDNLAGLGGVAYSDNGLSISNVYGSIHGNRGAVGGGLFYADEDLLVNNIYGSIFDNWMSHSDAGVFYAANGAVDVANIYGEIYDNGCTTVEKVCYGGVLFGDNSASLRNVNGSIARNHAFAGGVIYANGVSAIIANVAGDILDNYAFQYGGVMYSDGSGRIERVGGSILRNHNVYEGGGVMYCNSDCLLTAVAGDVSYNSAGDQGNDLSGGGVVYAEKSAVISDIGGSIQFNDGPRGGVAYGFDLVSISGVGGDISDNWALDGGGVAYALATVTIKDVGGDIARNHGWYQGGVVYTVESAVIENVRGSLIDNSVLTTGEGGILYVDDDGGVAMIRHIGGDIARNRAGVGGVAYSHGDVDIHSVGGDIADNFAEEFGGVAYSHMNTVIHDVEGWVVNNFASEIGGVICAEFSGYMYNIGGSVVDNAAGAKDEDGFGGVIYADDTAELRGVGGDVSRNTAWYGGVLYGQSSRLANVQGNVCENVAVFHGGVVYGRSDAEIESVRGYICSNAAQAGNGGVVWADRHGAITEAGLGICSNEAFGFGGVIYTDEGNAIIHSEATKITLNEARTGLGGVAYVHNRFNVSGVYGSVDVGEGFVSGNRDANDTNPRSLKGSRNVTLDFDGADLPTNVNVFVEFDGADSVANEFIRPGPIVNVTSFSDGIPLDFVIVVERDGLPPYYYQHDVDIEILPFGLYRFNNITLPEGDYQLRFQIVEGCGDGAVIATSDRTAEFSVSACQDPRPIQCPSEIIRADSDAFTCGAYVVVDDIVSSPDCDNVEYTNDYNSVTLGFEERVDGSASDVYPVGSTDVLLTVSAGSESFDCPVRVIVEDQRAFTSMTCPFPVQADTQAGVCTATVTVPLPTAIDNCPVRFENNVNTVEDASGVYPVGTTRVEFRGINDGPGSECTTKVTVTDREAPVITCPADFETTCEENDVFFQVSATDNCVGVEVSPVLHDVSPLGGVLAGGVNRYTYEAADAAGNTAQCSFVTTVQSTYYRDADGDGFGDPEQSAVWACNQPDGWVLDNTDCNDFNPNVYKLWFIDFDGDGFGNPAFPVCSDLNGTLPESFPLSRRSVRSVSSNHTVDNSTTPAPQPAPAPQPSGPKLIAGDELDNGSFDCDDSNPFVHPAAPELCDGIDNNCDGQVDELDNCPQQPPQVPVPVDVPVPVPVPVPNPIPNPVPVPVPVPVPYVVTVPAVEDDDDNAGVFSVSVSSASTNVYSVLLFVALLLSMSV